MPWSFQEYQTFVIMSPFHYHDHAITLMNFYREREDGIPFYALKSTRRHLCWSNDILTVAEEPYNKSRVSFLTAVLLSAT